MAATEIDKVGMSLSFSLLPFQVSFWCFDVLFECE